MNIEKVIFANLLSSEEYLRKVIPFLKEEYFHNSSERNIFNLIETYIKKYNRPPNREAMLIDLNNLNGMTEDDFKSATEFFSTVEPINSDMEWLVENTEKFVQDKAIYNAVMQSIKILDGKDNDNGKGAIPQLLTDALGVSFDSNIGHDYDVNADERYDVIHSKEEKLPFGLKLLDKITKGGIAKKTLTIFMGDTGGFKSGTMCHLAAHHYKIGKNVLYITLEMSEERIAERIDANLLDLSFDELEALPKEKFLKLVKSAKEKTVGKLIVKEYPTASAGSANFRHLLNELKLKKNFIPDVIYVDYLSICTSSRMKGKDLNSYTLVKAIAEELRGLAIEFNVPLVTGAQKNRGGQNSSDSEMTDVSESFGMAYVADLFLALISSEELSKLGQLMVKQLKNRYNDLDYFRRFVLGVNKGKMTLYDAEDNAQDGLIDIDSGAIFDSGEFAERERGKPSFKDFK